MKKMIKSKIFWVTLIILIGGLYFAYKLIFNNPKNIFLKYVNDKYTQLDKMYDDIFDSDISKIMKNKNYSLTTDVSLDINVIDKYENEQMRNLLDEINKLGINITSNYDAKNKELAYNLDLKYNEDSLLKTSIYGKDEKFYMTLDDLMNYYLKIDSKKINYDELFDTESSIKDSKIIIEKTKNAILNNISKNDFKTEKEVLLIDGKKVKSTKITYILNETKIRLLAINTLIDLQKDSEFMSSLEKITGTSQRRLNKSINKTIENLSKSSSDVSDEYISLSIYTKGLINEVVKTEISLVSEEEKINFECINYNNKKNIIIKSNEEEVATINIEEKNKKTITTIIIEKVKIVIQKEKDNYDYTIKIKDSDVYIEGSLEYKIDELKKNEEYKSNIKMNSKIFDKKEEIISVEILSNTKIKTITEIEMPNFDNVKAIEKLSSDDIDDIFMKMENNKNIINFISAIDSSVDL